MIFSLFWEGTFIRRGAFIRGGAFILKSEILGGRLFEGAFIRGGVFIRGNTVCAYFCKDLVTGYCLLLVKSPIPNRYPFSN